MSSDTTIYPVFPEQMIRAVKTYFLNNFTHEKAAHDKKYTLLVNYGHVGESWGDRGSGSWEAHL